jgi:hypothetical protein
MLVEIVTNNTAVNYVVYNFAVALADPSVWGIYVLVEVGKMYNINKTLSPFESFICRLFPLIWKFFTSNIGPAINEAFLLFSLVFVK